MLQSGEDRVAIVDDLVRRGQLAWYALPFVSHYDFAGIPGSLWGRNYARELSDCNARQRALKRRITVLVSVRIL